MALSNQIVTQYENGLRALKLLLNHAQEVHWAEQIQEHIKIWYTTQNASEHLKIYGRMGSFNDFNLCVGKQISQSSLIWANTLFIWLKNLCCFLAQHPNTFFSAEQLRSTFNGNNGWLLAYEDEDKLSYSVRNFAYKSKALHGAWCLNCEYKAVSLSVIDYFIAEGLIPEMVFDACEELSLLELVTNVLNLNIQTIHDQISKLKKDVVDSGIHIHESFDWISVCPKCSKGNMVGYQWILIGDRPPLFVPWDNHRPQKASIFHRIFDVLIHNGDITIGELVKQIYEKAVAKYKGRK